jgi:hypothetical protein
MNCVNCGRENPERALICYWCGLVPATGEPPYRALIAHPSGAEETQAVPEFNVVLPPPIEVPAPMPVPEVTVDDRDAGSLQLVIPVPPPIEIPPPPGIPDETAFSVERRRTSHRPIVRASTAPPPQMRSVLPGWGRLLVFFGGVALFLLLGLLLVSSVGVASFGALFCLGALLVLAAVVWAAMLLARVGRRVVTRTGAMYERVETLGQTLRAVAPGVIKELPVLLPKRMGVLDLPAAYSELQRLAGQEGVSSVDQGVDLVTGAIATLIGRDDVILLRRVYPVTTEGLLARSASREVTTPVLIRRRAYVGPGKLESRIAQMLRTDYPMSAGELVDRMLASSELSGAQEIVAWVDEALTHDPPDLDALDSPDAALAELQRFRDALRRADPELYKMMEDEVRRRLRSAMQRSAPSSLLDVTQYARTLSERSR